VCPATPQLEWRDPYAAEGESQQDQKDHHELMNFPFISYSPSLILPALIYPNKLTLSNWNFHWLWNK